mmetsp:Transcript_4812/g.11893  ORF Transcript_4812/g.11893 Transcript_4812/m.11893 type:complete len:357 (-) Transcript_4812:73-1143(-)
MLFNLSGWLHGQHLARLHEAMLDVYLEVSAAEHIAKNASAGQAQRVHANAPRAIRRRVQRGSLNTALFGLLQRVVVAQPNKDVLVAVHARKVDVNGRSSAIRPRVVDNAESGGAAHAHQRLQTLRAADDPPHVAQNLLSVHLVAERRVVPDVAASVRRERGEVHEANRKARSRASSSCGGASDRASEREQVHADLVLRRNFRRVRVVLDRRLHDLHGILVVRRHRRRAWPGAWRGRHLANAHVGHRRAEPKQLTSVALHRRNGGLHRGTAGTCHARRCRGLRRRSRLEQALQHLHELLRALGHVTRKLGQPRSRRVRLVDVRYDEQLVALEIRRHAVEVHVAIIRRHNNARAVAAR